MTLTAMTDEDLYTMPAAQAVANGAAWLDDNAPADWRDMIDTDTLDMWDGNKCILGQVFANPKSYLTGFEAGLRISGRSANVFSVPCGFVPFSTSGEELAAAWVSYLTGMESA